ncbi:UDP-N-acetylmuramoyl-L-alanyl-D-glutamate--2,6-diaminopimelate ligase [Arhodomonas sp. AD133]|uniref:UDP-N-acetylmuramoyl-L-alanyl-D-glutamate--2, 6-diaminopimelate ligase n=1 Tax=Arhodomonas sp. AD133 TaxID=3415009 RepID=UPI003EBB56D7
MTVVARPRLDDLLRPWGVSAPAVEVAALALDSRQVSPGGLFLAVAGTCGHGLEYLDDALARGAAAVVWEPAEATPAVDVEARCRATGAVAVAMPRLARCVGEVAARFFGEPGERLRLVGVTGTDGKTSTTQFIARALDTDVSPWAVVGTIGWGRPGALAPATHTTPDAVSLQRQLAALVDAGVSGAVLEVSSHALDQQRTGGLGFDVAVLTNLSRDHLDYHGTDEAYAAAKAKLFREPPPAVAVLNMDDPFGRRLAAEPQSPVVGYSVAGDRRARVCASAIETTPAGLTLSFTVDEQALTLALPLFGRFNAANVLATAATLLAFGFTATEMETALRRLHPVPGRMEALGGGARPTVVVDYAHTPAALAAALEAVREHFPGRLWCVCGCGGDRDRGKRPLMAEAAARLADEVVFTSDNPRSESPGAILEDMRAGLPAGRSATLLVDRAEAIAHAVGGAGAGDAVLIAGKGHEDYQIVGDRRLAFSDRAVVETALEAGEAG